MKKGLFLFLPVFALIAFTAKPLITEIQASSMIISSSSDFASQAEGFLPNQTVYVKVEANNSGETKKELNLRSNSYDFIASYPLTNIGNNVFTASFQAPGSGYYSLEAKIESHGSNSTSVKTLRVGASTNPSIHVNVNSNNSSSNSNEKVSTQEEKNSPSPTLPPPQTPTPKAPQSFFQKISSSIKTIFGSFWLLKSIF